MMVFISYKRADLEAVKLLSRSLAQWGYVPWFDLNLIVGQEWRDQLRTKLEQADRAIVIWSNNSLDRHRQYTSREVAWEADTAEKAGKLIPISIEDGCLHEIQKSKHAIQLKSVLDIENSRAQICDALGRVDLAKKLETDAFLKVEHSFELRECELFLQTFPASRWAPLVRERVELLKAWPKRRWQDSKGNLPEVVGLAGGSFTIGSLKDERDRDPSEGPRRRVKIKPFAMSVDPITWSQYRYALNMSSGLSTPDLDLVTNNNAPVTGITWADANAYCRALSETTGQTYRLPSEAEWEYACRAGTDTAFATGETITPTQAVYNWSAAYNNCTAILKSRPIEPRAVNAKEHFVNDFGLRAMHGNVWEWTADAWWHNLKRIGKDGSANFGTEVEPFRVVRGGSWASLPKHLRSSFRGRWDPTGKKSIHGDGFTSSASGKARVRGHDRIGFRVVREAV